MAGLVQLQSVPHDTPIPLPLQRTRTSAREALAAAAGPRAGAGPAARSLYIHVPFCFHKCHYCDFYSIVDTRDRQEPFVARLERELAALAPFAAGEPLRTIFVGGGTPSLLAPHLWRKLLATIDRLFDLSRIRSGGGEFTVECNPETVTGELSETLAAGGVDRISMGAQSFNPVHLKTLERWHDPASVPRALELAAAAGIRRRSFDLIFGIPGQTLDDWLSDLRTALSLGTQHLSCYNLTYEPNTAMTARLKRGEFEAADEDLEVDMYAATLSTLRAAGFERYEVSNYAAPGQESRHNLVYWRQEPWLAAGPSASGYAGGVRWKNAPRLDDYLGFDDEGFAPVVEIEPPDAARAVRETLMTGLRLREGVDTAAVLRDAAAVDPAAPEKLLGMAARYRAEGLMLAGCEERWSLNDAGILIADGIAADFMACIGGGIKS